MTSRAIKVLSSRSYHRVDRWGPMLMRARLFFNRDLKVESIVRWLIHFRPRLGANVACMLVLGILSVWSESEFVRWGRHGLVKPNDVQWWEILKIFHYFLSLLLSFSELFYFVGRLRLLKFGEYSQVLLSYLLLLLCSSILHTFLKVWDQTASGISASRLSGLGHSVRMHKYSGHPLQ